MSAIEGPNATRTTATEASELGFKSVKIKPKRTGSSPRLDAAEAKSKSRYAAIAKSDAMFEDFAFALTGKTAEERTPAENQALAQLRQEMLDGTIDPDFVEAGPANGPGADRLPSGVRGAFVSGGDGEQGRVLISGNLRGKQLQQTSDEEQGEAVADRAAQLGITVADGDAGARVSSVANGTAVSPDDNPNLFVDQASDETTVISNGEVVTAKADADLVANGDNLRTGADGKVYDLNTAAGQQGYVESFDTNGDGLDRNELKAALGGDDVPDEKVDRFMQIYGTYDDRFGVYVIPTSGANSLKSTSPGYEYTGVGQMVSDGALYYRSGEGWENIGSSLGNASNDTLSHAMIRHAAIESHKNKPDGDTTSSRESILWYQTNGMEAPELDAATDTVLGDKKPLDSKNGHRDVIVGNFATEGSDGKRINADGLTQAFGRGALKRKQSDSSDDSIIGFSAHREPTGARKVPDIEPGKSDRLALDVRSFFGTTGSSSLFAASASNEENGKPLGVYVAPHFSGQTTLPNGLPGSTPTLLQNDQIPIQSGQMVRHINGVGTVTWTFHDHGTTIDPSEPISITIDESGKQDRYLQDYQAFGALLEENQPGPNLSKASAVTGPGGSKVEVWMPREHQFAETVDGQAAETYAAPVVTVDGAPAQVTGVEPVRLPDGSVVYQITAQTANGETVNVSQHAKTDTETAALQNLNAQVNGGNGVPVPSGVSSAEEVAGALNNLPPEEAGEILNSMGYNDATAVLTHMEPQAAANALATQPPQEVAEIVNTMMETDDGLLVAAKILAAMNPGNAGLILAELDQLPDSHAGQGQRGLTTQQQEYKSQRLFQPMTRFTTRARVHQTAQMTVVAANGGAADPVETGAYMQGANTEIYGAHPPTPAGGSLTEAALNLLLSFTMPPGTSPEHQLNINAARLVKMPRDDAAEKLTELAKDDPAAAAQLLNVIAMNNPEAAMEILMQMSPEDNQKIQAHLDPTAKAKIHAAWQAAGEPAHQQGPAPDETVSQTADRLVADGNPAVSANELTTLAKSGPGKAAHIISDIAQRDPQAAADIMEQMPPATLAQVLPSVDARLIGPAMKLMSPDALNEVYSRLPETYRKNLRTAWGAGFTAKAEYQRHAASIPPQIDNGDGAGAPSPTQAVPVATDGNGGYIYAGVPTDTLRDGTEVAFVDAVETLPDGTTRATRQRVVTIVGDDGAITHFAVNPDGTINHQMRVTTGTTDDGEVVWTISHKGGLPGGGGRYKTAADVIRLAGRSLFSATNLATQGQTVRSSAPVPGLQPLGVSPSSPQNYWPTYDPRHGYASFAAGKTYSDPLDHPDTAEFTTHPPGSDAAIAEFNEQIGQMINPQGTQTVVVIENGKRTRKVMTNSQVFGAMLADQLPGKDTSEIQKAFDEGDFAKAYALLGDAILERNLGNMDLTTEEKQTIREVWNSLNPEEKAAWTMYSSNAKVFSVPGQTQPTWAYMALNPRASNGDYDNGVGVFAHVLDTALDKLNEPAESTGDGVKDVFAGKRGETLWTNQATGTRTFTTDPVTGNPTTVRGLQRVSDAEYANYDGLEPGDTVSGGRVSGSMTSMSWGEDVDSTFDGPVIMHIDTSDAPFTMPFSMNTGLDEITLPPGYEMQVVKKDYVRNPDGTIKKDPKGRPVIEVWMKAAPVQVDQQENQKAA